jgi:hypothetical protein
MIPISWPNSVVTGPGLKKISGEPGSVPLASAPEIRARAFTDMRCCGIRPDFGWFLCACLEPLLADFSPGTPAPILY